MDDLKKCKNNSTQPFSSVIMISIMITLLTVSASMNISVVLATEREGEEYDDDIDIGTIKNNELSALIVIIPISSGNGNS